MKVVINKCYGGFSISALAQKRIAELKGKQCFFFERKLKPGGGFEKGYSPISLEEANKSFMHYAFSIPNPNEVLTSDESWFEMSQKEKEAHNNLYERHSISASDYDRHDPLLIQVVEELGEKANGKCSKLAIVEIPDGTDYEVEEYDGMEWVAEKHKTWR